MRTNHGILAYTDELVLADGRVKDATAALKRVLSDDAILEEAPCAVGTSACTRC